MIWNRSNGSVSNRKPRGRWRWWALGLVLLTGMFFLCYPYPPLPSSEIAQARTAVRDAQRRVKDFAQNELKLAENLAVRMEQLYAIEAAKLLRFAEPTETMVMAAEVEKAARQAIALHDDLRAKALSQAQIRRAELESVLKDLRAEIRFFTRDRRLRTAFHNADTAMIEARRAQANSDAKRLESALQRVEASLEATEVMLGNRYKRFSDPSLRRKWQHWVDETIASSRGGGLAIVVDKLGRRLVLFRAGRPVLEFPAEFGRNGLSDKLHAGDGATPEGRYFVREKRDVGNTRWHRALVINYPNAEDWQQYQKARRTGSIGRYSIGGLIEIHGNGGKQSNWTDGCVALTNREMDRLFSQVPVGTPVTIVGSAQLPGDSANRQSRLGGTR
jgi:hypothetical protein